MMDDKSYFSAEGMSATLLKAGAVSMLNMHHRATTRFEATPAMRYGTLGHMCTLEPEKFGALIVCDESKRTKAYKEKVAEYGADNIITSTDRESLLAAREIVMNHPAVKELGLFDGGESEVARFWDCDHGPCKCKCDWLSGDGQTMVEYKTTSSLENFERQSYGLAYHLQLGFYHRGSCADKVVVVAQESRAPYDVAVYIPWQYDLKQWYARCLDIYQKYNQCLETGVFPGRYDHAMEFTLPAWAQEETEVEA